MDLTVFLAELAAASPKVAGTMRSIGMGATTTRSRRYRAGYEESPICLRCGEADEDEIHRLWGCPASSELRHRHGLEAQALGHALGHAPCAAFLARCLVPRQWTQVEMPHRSPTPVQEPEGWLEQIGGLQGVVATDGTAAFGEDHRLRLAAWGLWAPLAGGVSLEGPLPGKEQTVPRAELWAVLAAVQHAVAPILLLIDNEVVWSGVAAVSRSPVDYPIDLRSEMADLWRELKEILQDKAAGFCDAIWVPSHAMQPLTDPDLEAKRCEKLRRARSQANWREEWLEYNDRADQAATRARRRHPVQPDAVARV